MIFPEHMSMTIQHNPHKEYYESIETWLNDQFDIKAQDNEMIQKCVKADELWVLVIYPNTPVSFDYSFAPTLEEAITDMKAGK